MNISTADADIRITKDEILEFVASCLLIKPLVFDQTRESLL